MVLLIQDSIEDGAGQSRHDHITLADSCLAVRTSRADVGYEIARTVHPDLIVVDLARRGGNGRTICRLLKVDPVTASIPVVVLAAVGSPDTLSQSEHLGAVAVLERPCSVDAFALAMRSALAA